MKRFKKVQTPPQTCPFSLVHNRITPRGEEIGVQNFDRHISMTQVNVNTEAAMRNICTEVRKDTRREIEKFKKEKLHFIFGLSF